MRPSCLRVKVGRHSVSALRPTSRRAYSTSPPSRPVWSRISPSAPFTALLCVGIGATSYGIYQLYKTLTVWPPEVRADLRAGISAKNKGDFDVSEAYLRKAHETAQTLSLSVLQDSDSISRWSWLLPTTSYSPQLKLSGIATTLGGVLEAAHKYEEAYTVYRDEFERLRKIVYPDSSNGSGSMPGQENVRLLSLSHKLGQLAEQLHKPLEEEEKWLVWSLEEALKIAVASSPSSVSSTSSQSTTRSASGWSAGSSGSISDEHEDEESEHDSERIVLASLPLPPWLSKADLGAPMEALAGLYERVGKVELALPLYLHSVSLLVPPGSLQNRLPVGDACRAASLMHHIIELLIHPRTPIPSSLPKSPTGVGSLTEERLHQAESWGIQSLELLQRPEVTTFLRDHQALAVPPNKTSSSSSGSWFGTSSQTSSSEEEDEETELCGHALAAAYFNLGILRELREDFPTARKLYVAALHQSTKMASWQESKSTDVNGSETETETAEGIIEARSAVRRLDSMKDTKM